MNQNLSLKFLLKRCLGQQPTQIKKAEFCVQGDQEACQSVSENRTPYHVKHFNISLCLSVLKSCFERIFQNSNTCKNWKGSIFMHWYVKWRSCIKYNRSSIWYKTGTKFQEKIKSPSLILIFLNCTKASLHFSWLFLEQENFKLNLTVNLHDKFQAVKLKNPTIMWFKWLNSNYGIKPKRLLNSLQMLREVLHNRLNIKLRDISWQFKFDMSYF